MARKIFTDESLATFISGIKSYVNEQLLGKSDKDHTHDTYETKENSQLKYDEAKTYTDTEIANLINSAPTTLDTLGEIATAMSENEDVVEALEAAIGTKANADDLNSHVSNTSNPHNVTTTQLGLSSETWTITLVDGNVITKNVVVM